MPIATPEKYAEMLDTAKAQGFAFPAINVSSSQTLNAALQGFADAGSDGIVQVSTGGADYLSGPNVKNMVTGSVAFAAYAAEVAKSYPVNIALHTDHCPKDKLEGFVRPLVDISAERVARGELPLFQSHMWDGSAVPLEENLQIAEELLAKCAAAHIILEIEVGVVGGEEDGVEGAIDDKLYTHARGRPGHRARARHRREGSLPHGADLRQRARRLQARQRQAPPGGAQGSPGSGRQGPRPRRRRPPLRPGLPRRLGLVGRRDQRRGRLRRGEDERRHRHPVRLHPPRRRPHVRQLRRRAQGRRRGRQQEGLRPARLGQGRRGRDGRPRRRGLREPPRQPVAPSADPRIPCNAVFPRLPQRSVAGKPPRTPRYMESPRRQAPYAAPVRPRGRFRARSRPASGSRPRRGAGGARRTGRTAGRAPAPRPRAASTATWPC